jgi:CubicO group peptidase (beta-lactamase class C family)
MKTHPNPDLSVLEDNKQRWNHPAYRRHGFHNAHTLFRRSWMFRSRNVLELKDAPISELNTSAEIARLTDHPAFSALVVLKNDTVVYSKSAKDFSIFQPHSIQSVTKLHIHLIVGQLHDQGLLDLDQKVCHYLPDIGTGYADATLQMLLDMNVANDFSEDYADPNSDCYTEETALGWRLPSGNAKEPTLAAFTAGITGTDLQNPLESADYKSANTDVLTLVCASVSPQPLSTLIEDIVDAAGYEGAFHISVSSDQMPAFSGGGCISAIDLARFGLLLTRSGRGCTQTQVGSGDFLSHSTTRGSKSLSPPKGWLRYSNHLMTNGNIVGHAGYGGQYLFANVKTGVVVAFMSVLENDAGYDDVYMGEVAQDLATIIIAVDDLSDK